MSIGCDDNVSQPLRQRKAQQIVEHVGYDRDPEALAVRTGVAEHHAHGQHKDQQHLPRVLNVHQGEEASGDRNGNMCIGHFAQGAEEQAA